MGLDGQVHEIPPNLSLDQFRVLISNMRDVMYQNSGSVGSRDSLNMQGGEATVSRMLNDTARRLTALDILEDLRSSPEHNRKLDALESSLDTTRSRQETEEQYAARRRWIGEHYQEVQRKIRQLELDLEAEAEQLAKKKSGWSRGYETVERLRERVKWLEQEREKNQKLMDFDRAMISNREGTQHDRDMAEIRIERMRDKMAREAYMAAPIRDRLRLMEALPSLIVATNEALYRNIPRALGGYFPAQISPELYKAVEEKIKSDPAYAADFQREMMIHPDTKDRKEAKPVNLFIGGVQGLELFLAAGRALPDEKRAKPSDVKILHSNRFDVNTTPLFSQLNKEYGIDVGKSNGLHFVGTPSVSTLHAANTPHLAAAVAASTEPTPSRTKPDSRFKMTEASCGLEQLL